MTADLDALPERSLEIQYGTQVNPPSGYACNIGPTAHTTCGLL